MRKKWFLSVLVLFLLLSLLVSQEMNAFTDDADEDFEGINAGRQYLLLIAIDQYPNWTDLKDSENKIGPIYDALRLKEVLQKHYHFDDTIELYNQKATKKNIVEQLERLNRLEINDSLFIYFSGHGKLDKNKEKGYWIPYDGAAPKSSQRNWLDNYELRSMIKKIKSNHILIVSDSCFSGALVRDYKGTDEVVIGMRMLQSIYHNRSRKILTAGGEEKVPTKSIFAKCFIDELEKNGNNLYVKISAIHAQIEDKVIADTWTYYKKKGNTPRYGDIGGFYSDNDSRFILFTKKGWKYLVEPYQRNISSPIPGTPEFFLENGIKYLNAGNYDIAEKELMRTFTRKPDKKIELIALNTLGILYIKQKKLDKAEVQFNRVIRLDRNHFDAYNYLGVVYTEKENYDSAKEYLLKAAHSEDYLTPEYAYTNLAALEMKYGNLDSALRYIENGLKENRDFAELYYLNGMIFEKKNEYFESIYNYKLAIKALDKGDVDEVSCLIDLGRVYAKAGDKNEALNKLDEAWIQTKDPQEKKRIEALKKKVQNG